MLFARPKLGVLVVLSALNVAGETSASPPAGSGKEAPPASVPAPRKLALSDVPPAINWPMSVSAPDSPLDFRVNLDLLAPLGTGTGNLGAWLKDFAKPDGSRLAEAEAASARRKTVKMGGQDQSVLPGDDPLLREAEPWVDQATCRFYPDLFPMKGFETQIPNLLFSITLARSWVVRGDASVDREAAKADFRRAVRLGRLLRQEDVTLIQDLVGLACIRIGLMSLFEEARREQDGPAMVVTAQAIEDATALRLATTDRLNRVLNAVTDRLETEGIMRRLLGPALSIDETRLESVLSMARKGPRRFRFEAMGSVWIVKSTASGKQKEAAAALLKQLTSDPDPLIAANAKYLEARKWTAETSKMLEHLR